jgi:hypothetical protein
MAPAVPTWQHPVHAGPGGPLVEAPMRRALPVAIGAVLLVVGAVWTFQGLGYLGGSPMTGVAVSAIVGPLVAGLGVALVVVGVRGPR